MITPGGRRTIQATERNVEMQKPIRERPDQSRFFTISFRPGVSVRLAPESGVCTSATAEPVSSKTPCELIEGLIPAGAGHVGHRPCG
jgi:hypothetical protein